MCNCNYEYSRQTTVGGGLVVTKFKYDFTGNVLASEQSVKPTSTSNPDVVRTFHRYDHAMRILQDSVVVNDGTPAIVKYEYDEIGRLKKQVLGDGNTNATTYAYNVRSQITSQANPHLNISYRYQDSIKTTTTAQYGGNISEIEWQHAGLTSNIYAFDYDDVNRLTNTTQYVGSETTASNQFVEQGLLYATPLHSTTH